MSVPYCLDVTGRDALEDVLADAKSRWPQWQDHIEKSLVGLKAPSPPGQK
jgi:hypothetical protein